VCAGDFYLSFDGDYVHVQDNQIILLHQGKGCCSWCVLVRFMYLKFELHKNDLSFPFIHLIDLDLFQEFFYSKRHTHKLTIRGSKHAQGIKLHCCTKFHS
jgi:hypothetical protein